MFRAFTVRVILLPGGLVDDGSTLDLPPNVLDDVFQFLILILITFYQSLEFC